MAAGLVCLVGLGQGRTLVLPTVVAGGVFLGDRPGGADGRLRPRRRPDDRAGPGRGRRQRLPLARPRSDRHVGRASSTTSPTSRREPRPVDPGRVGADARLAHEILVAVSAAVGLLLVLIAPLAVSLGLAGAVLAVLCCVVVMLRTRQYRTGPEVLVGLVSGIAGLLAASVTALWVHPDWRPADRCGARRDRRDPAGGHPAPALSTVRRGRLGDVAESVALLALLPVALVAVGAFSAIRG